MNILLKRTYLTSGLLFLGLIISVAAANSIIFFAEPGSRLVYSELIVTAAAAAAIIAVVGILLAYRQVIYNRSHSKSYISMAVGLVFWLCADILLIDIHSSKFASLTIDQ